MTMRQTDLEVKKPHLIMLNYRLNNINKESPAFL